MDTMGKRLRALRGDQDMSQADVEAATGVERSHLSAIENDKGKPSLASARALAQFFGVSLEWLVEGRGPKHMDPRTAAILAALDALPPDERESYLRIIFERGSGAADAA
jgi:transcriptional regulator with XRE-family HTH domain